MLNYRDFAFGFSSVPISTVTKCLLEFGVCSICMKHKDCIRLTKLATVHFWLQKTSICLVH